MAGVNQRVVGFATQGAGSLDHQRVASLMEAVGGEPWVIERTSRGSFARRLWKRLKTERPALVVMEGTGLAGGLLLVAARIRFGTRYVVSSGDAVAPFFGLKRRWLRPIGFVYERALMRGAVGFVGWTPYLVGRAVSLGCPRGITVPGWAPSSPSTPAAAVRARRGLAATDVVFGIVGSLQWNPRVGYCYGHELVKAAVGCDRADLRVVVVGGGDGLDRLRALAAGDPRIVFTGKVSQAEAQELLSAFDYASLAQSVDDVGSFRYTTKLSEYAAVGVSVVSTEIPASFDIDGVPWVRLPGEAPWDPTFEAALREFMAKAGPHSDRPAGPPAMFERSVQLARFGAFVEALLR